MLTKEDCKGCPQLKEIEPYLGDIMDTCTFWGKRLRRIGRCSYVGRPDLLEEAIERNKNFKGVW